MQAEAEMSSARAANSPVAASAASRGDQESVGRCERAAAACQWRHCRKTAKLETSDEALRPCSSEKCTRMVHAACFASMRESFGAPSSFNDVICGKRCYNALIKKVTKVAATSQGTKKHVMWESDGPTPDVSLLSVMLDWLTSGNNYDRYRGGDSQTGETKLVLANEITRAIADAGVTTVRTAKDVTNKISLLEKQYRVASDWLANTGQGVTDERQLRQAIIDRCPYYFELRDTLEDRLSTRPQLLNTDLGAMDGNTDDNDDAAADAADDADAVDSVSVTNSEASSNRSAGSRPDPAGRMITIVQPTKKQRTNSTTPAPPPPLLALKEAQLQQQREFKSVKLQLRERKIALQEMNAVEQRQRLAHATREVDARIEEAAAQTAKLREEAQQCRQQQKIVLLRERAKLLQEGVSQANIDLLLPLDALID